MRELAKRMVVRLGLERQARLVREVWQPMRRRDRLDDEHFRIALAASVSASSSCIDVGANVGKMLAAIVEICPAGRHLAIEPVPEAAALLAERFPDVDVRAHAVGAQSGVAEFVHVREQSTRSALIVDEATRARDDLEVISTRVERLDDIVPDDMAPDFVKIDVEGAELDVLRGARTILERHRPTIWFEWGGGRAALFGGTSPALWDLLCGEHGYRIFDADGRGPMAREAFGRPSERPMWTFLARPG